MCSESWVGSDCSIPRDFNSLLWETLLDTQMTVVRTKEKRTNNPEVCMADTTQHTQINIVLPPPQTEPGPQVPPQDGTLSGVWTTGQPLDVWRAFSDRGNSGKCL